MHFNLSADEVLATTRSVRQRLDFERPVERETVMECLELALQAPTGSNRQGWQWMFVTDDHKQLALRDIYRENFNAYRKMPRPENTAGDPRSDRADKVIDSATHLAEEFHRAPTSSSPAASPRRTSHTGTPGRQRPEHSSDASDGVRHRAIRYSTRRSPAGVIDGSSWGRSTTNSVRCAGK